MDPTDDEKTWKVAKAGLPAWVNRHERWERLREQEFNAKAPRSKDARRARQIPKPRLT